MCGICGFLEFRGFSAADRAIAERMNSTLSHRGPDAAGAFAAGGAAIAMSRLSVIDVACGQQPISTPDGRRWIVYNGEVYNFPELRRELEARGHSFRTHSDTEVVLGAYEEWGPECVQRLRGMFAFCILEVEGSSSDRPGGGEVRRLFLARDRVGKKPLYYYRDASRFVFGSEIKAILAHPEVPREVNRGAIPLYLAYGYVPAPDTMFAGIHELPPGHTLTVERGQLSIREYWDERGTKPEAHSLGDTIERLRVLLEDAVRIRLISDVPLGAFLSGGLDSTAIVAYMTRLMDQPVKTFAIGFADDPTFNELDHARRAARAYGTDHHEFVVRPDAVELLPKLVWHHDQPFADSSAVPTYLVSKLTRGQVTVALTGDGGDELFAGYERFAAARLAETYRKTPQVVQAGLAGVVRRLPESTSYGGTVRRARRFLESAPLPLAHRYLGWVGIFDAGFIRELLADEPVVDPLAHFQGYFDRVRDRDSIAQLLYVNARTYLPGDLLVKTDRMSMAASLEARSPFLDQELIRFASTIPSNLKLRGVTTKYILKKAMDGIVPREIVYRKKHGFGVPVGRWFRADLSGYVREVLLGPRAQGRGYFTERVVKQLLDEHQSGRRDHAHRLWTLLTFELWHQVFIDAG